MPNSAKKKKKSSRMPISHEEKLHKELQHVPLVSLRRHQTR